MCHAQRTGFLASNGGGAPDSGAIDLIGLAQTHEQHARCGTGGIEDRRLVLLAAEVAGREHSADGAAGPLVHAFE